MKILIFIISFFLMSSIQAQIQESNENDSNSVICKVEKQAYFNDSLGSFHKFLESNLRIPKSWISSLPNRQNSTRETVEIQFIVCNDGTVCDIKALNNPTPILAQEGIRIIEKSSGKWKPGEQDGKAVKTYFRQKITFVCDAD